MTYGTLARMSICTAHRSNGVPCRATAIRGGSVCVTHGGAARQVKQKAAERLAALVDPAITRLAQLLHDPLPAVALAAAKDILDRAGFRATDRLEQSGNVTIEVEYVNKPMPSMPAPTNGHVVER